MTVMALLETSGKREREKNGREGRQRRERMVKRAISLHGGAA
jgi:hypothetical protein